VTTQPPNEPGLHTPQSAQVLAMLRWLLIALFVVLAWFVLSYLAGVLAPILAALGIAYLLNPVLNRLVRAGFSRGAGAAVLLFGFLALLVATITFLVPRIADELAAFLRSLPTMVITLGAWLHDHFGVDIPKDWSEALKNNNLADSLSSSEGRCASSRPRRSAACSACSACSPSCCSSRCSRSTSCRTGHI